MSIYNKKLVKVLSLGAGNMAEALLFPMKGAFQEFHAFTPTGKRAKSLAQSMDGQSIDSLSMVPRDIDILFLAFKPQHYQDAVSDFLSASDWANWDKKPIIVSMLAGTPISVLEKYFGHKRVLRIMPNTPAKIGMGITLLLPGDDLGTEEISLLENLFEMAGPIYSCRDEDQFDALTAVTGSGPAYVFEFSRILESFLQEKGVEEKKARELAVSLLVGSSNLMQESSLPLEELRNNVTSKNGVTFAALESLKENDFGGSIKQALEKNIERSFELREVAYKMNS